MNDLDPIDGAFPTIKDLYPEMSSEELVEAEENLSWHAEFSWRLYQEILADPIRHAKLIALTDQEHRRRMEANINDNRT